jgi:hypothetical protein
MKTSTINPKEMKIENVKFQKKIVFILTHFKKLKKIEESIIYI